MALQKTIVTKGVTVTNAFHLVEAVRVTSDAANVSVKIFKDSTCAENSANLLDRRNYPVSDQNFTDYFGTSHATKNILQRGQDYLKDEVTEYNGATEV